MRKRSTIMKKICKLFLLLIALIAALTIVAVATSNTEAYPDAMTDIVADEYLESKKIESLHLEKDGYLGIPVDLTVYHNGSVVDGGCNGTTVILYVVNTHATRTGTDSDVSIITSMVNRDYIVVVADYHNHKKAVTPDLDWAVQSLMQKVKGGKIFTSTAYKTSYKECFVVPAGHNLERDRVFWQFDRHGADGTLEKIVEVWNLDFRGMKGSYVIPWHNDGVRKETQTAFDGSEPVWYSIGSGENQITHNGVNYIPDENGLYIRVKHTKANEITDCVKKDGSPIDLNLYLHVIYPTNPEKSVPIMTLASSSEHLASGCVSDQRPHTNGFGFDGYAVAMYDYAYVPMARTDHYGYFDGSSPESGSVTGDNFTYSLFTYNLPLVPTAALRYLRYLSLTEGDTFKFNGTIGVIGNSKGSVITQLADLDLGLVKSTADGYTESELETFAYEYIKSFNYYYFFEGHNGETRYDMNHATYTKNGATIDGGEIQPWLTYNGEMIPSGAQFVYSSCGSTTGYVDENFAPFMTSAHIGIETNGYGGNNHMVNIARYYDIPFIYFELFLGHTFLSRDSSNELEIDPYVGYKNFAHYVLSGAAPTVMYVTPLAGGEVSATPSFTVKFSGIIPEEEAAKITLTDSQGNAVLGTLTSAYGKTEWTFTPSVALKSGEKYTLNVPTTIKGDNGKALVDAHSATYYTEVGESTSLSVNETVVTTENGLSLELTVPNFSSLKDKNINRAELRLFVRDNAANALSVYLGDEDGECLGTLAVGGVGHYALNLTEALAQMTPGEKVTLFVKADKASGNSTPTDAKFTIENFDDGTSSFTISRNVNSEYREFEGHGKALGVSPIIRKGSRNATHKYYATVTALTADSILPTSMGTDDYGRRFLITFDVYDTSSRRIYAEMHNLSNKNNGLIDYHSDRVNVQTKAGEWTTVTLLYTMEEPLYGKNGMVAKNFSISVGPTGSSEDLIFFDNFRIEEITTDTTISSAALVLTSDGGDAYKQAEATLPFYIGENGYATLAEAVSALGTADGTITLKRNVTLADADVLRNINAKNVTLDLNGYAIHTACKSNSLISVTTAVETITVKNGSLFLSGGSLVGFEATKVAGNLALTLENVHVGLEKGATVREMLVNVSTVGAVSKVHIVFDECTVDMRESRFTKNPVRMLPLSTAKVTITAEMTGGEFWFDRLDKTTFLESLTMMQFHKGESGYATIYFNAARSFPNVAALTDEGFANFAPDADAKVWNGYNAFTPNLDTTLSTPYGIIPEKYADTEAYPLAIFKRDDFSFVGASNILIQDSGEGVFNEIYHTEGSFVIYLRRDYTHATASYNMGFIMADVLVDLGGHTMTYERGITPQAKVADYNTRVTFYNGTLKAKTTAPFIAPGAVKYEQPLTFTFKDITFAVESGYAPEILISRTNSSSSVSAEAFVLRVTVEDCVIDTTNITAKTTLFSIGHSKGVIDDGVTLIGSNIYGDPSNINLVTYTGTENCFFTVAKGADGNYITNTRPTESATPDTSVLLGDELMIFAKALSEQDGMTTYALSPDPTATPYGKIPSEYRDATKYPILLFSLSSKTVVWAGNRWGGEGTYGGVMSQLHKNCTKGSYAIYFQGDYVDAAGEDGKLQTYYNMGSITGNHIIDLAGHTFTANSQVFYAQAKNQNFTSNVTYTIKNGTINLGTRALISVGSNTYDQQYTHTGNYNFENVNITNIQADGVLVRDDVGGDYLTTTNVTFRDCTFEIAATRSLPLFRCNTAKSTTHAIHIQVLGGAFEYVGAAMPKIFDCGTLTNKSFLYGEGKDGLPSVTTAKNANSYENIAQSTTLGNRYFIAEANGEDKVTYYLCEKTAYGLIPHKYTDKTAYPYLLFNAATGKLIDGFSVWATEDESSVLGYFTKKSGQFVILLQRDVQLASGEYKNYLFGNSKSGNTLLVDLGGHEFGAFGSFMYLQARSNYELNVTVKNGTIRNSGDSTLLPIGARSYSIGKVTNLTFENVHFILDDRYASIVSDSRENENTTTVNITFNGCKFTTLAQAENPLFFLGENAKLADVNIKVNGGEIIVLGKFNLFTNGGRENKTITFGKWDGKYTSLKLGAGTEVSTLTMPGENGILGFRKTGQEGTNTIYTLTDFNFVSAYLNLTNDLNFIYRAFLPYGYTNPVVTFTIGTSTIEVSAYTVDENGLYLFRLPNINPARMGETITATLTATLGEEEVTVTHSTLSVKKYAEALKAENADDTALCTLIDNLLVYGAAAQQYVGQNADQYVTNIGELPAIPEEKDTLTLTGDASDVASITKVGMRLEGAFALRITVKASDITGLTLCVTKGSVNEVLNFADATANGDEYVFLYDGILANELDEMITVTVQKDGATLGKTLTVSANAYLCRQDGQNANLTTLVRALYLYGESAKSYNK